MKQRKSISTDLEVIMPLLINIWRRFKKENGPGDKLQTREFRSVVAAIQKLKKGLSEEMDLIGIDYFADSDILGAYLLYNWVIHYQEGLSVIGELPITPRRVLDVCSGPAPFAFAALRHGATEVYATDRNMTALELGAEVCGRYGMTLTKRSWNCHKEPLPISGTFDLITVGHCLEELFPPTTKGWVEKQHLFLNGLLQKLSPTGFLILVESSFGESNRRLLQLRDRFVNDGIAIQAPCVWKGQCPALQTANSPCYAQREMEKPYLISEIQRASSINLGSLKMSYLITRSPHSQWPKLPEKPLYRIISPPFESHQGTAYYLCGTSGKKRLATHLTVHPKESRAFEYLKRGELISIENALEQGNSLEIIEGTNLIVESACGKPIPEN
jgi:SAM-dependent methyltransferase